MKLRLCFILLLCFCIHQNSFAQPGTDEKAASIPDTSCTSVASLSSYIKQNFSTGSARVRAIYIWITGHISYDVQRFLARNENNKFPVPGADEILTKRAGVCQGYTDLFIALCKNVNVNAIRISGYTKKDAIIGAEAHAWVAAELDGVWWLFDPTWGAGYVHNEKFVRKYNEEFYKVTPAKFIERHMPFDPLYQFLDYPLSNNEFIEGKPATNKTKFYYADSIKVQQQLSFAAQTSAELRRMEAAGTQHRLLQERRTYLKNVLQSSASKNSYDEGLVAYRSAVSLHKTITEHRRTQFSSITDADLKQAVDSAEFYIRQSRELVLSAVPKTEAQWSARTRQTAIIDKLWTELVRQKDFIAKYLSYDKEKRKQLFIR